MNLRWSCRLVVIASMQLAACATLTGREPVVVDVVGVEPLASQGMEGRFLVKLRVQNPNTEPVAFDGVSITLDVRGSRLASGVSDVSGSVPRFGETVLAVPVTVPISAMVAQALGLATGDRLPDRLRAERPAPRPRFRWRELPLQRRVDAAERRRSGAVTLLGHPA